MKLEDGAPLSEDPVIDPAPDLARGKCPALRARLVQSELRTEALRAGMVDLDGVRLIDPAAVQLTEAGTLDGGAALMARLRQDKPWLFGRRQAAAAAGRPRRRRRRLRPGRRWTWGWRSGGRRGPSCCGGVYDRGRRAAGADRAAAGR